MFPSDSGMKFPLATTLSPTSHELPQRPSNAVQLPPAVRRRVRSIQRRWPWKTYINTYWQHPPGFNNFYTRKSFDVWGGGGNNSINYSGYRGKTLPRALGDDIFVHLFYASNGPAIDWIIWQGEMWWNPATGGPGWTDAPPGPADSDADHMKHIHVTFVQ